MKFNRVLPWYALLLIIILCALLMNVEGFTTSPASFMTDIANKSVFVLFYTPSCGHCAQLKPIWDKFSAANPDSTTLVDCSGTDKTTQAITTKYKITSYPTMVWIVNGQIQETYEGDRTVDGLNKFLSDHVATTPS
jgi:thioredoxin-like negative regulator of GroEL